MKITEWRWNRILIIGFLLFLVSMAMPIFLLLILSLLVSVLLFPAIHRVEDASFFAKISVENRRVWSIAIVFILTIVTLVFGIYFIFRPLMAELASFISSLPETVAFFHEQLKELLNFSQSQYSILPAQLRDLIDSSAQKALTILLDSFNRFLKFLMDMTPVLVQAVLLPFLVYYFLKDQEKILGDTVSLFPVRRKKSVAGLLRNLGETLSDYIRGQLIVCLITGVLVFVGTSALGVRYPLVLGSLAFLLEFIPYAGPILAFLPAFLLALTDSTDLALKVTLFYLFVSFVENYFVIPKVMGKALNIHPLIVLIGMLLAANWFGLIGMMLAVPAIATLRILIRFIWNW